MIFSCISLLLYASFLVFVTRLVHIGRFFSFLGNVTWHFQIWNLFPFLVGLYKNWKHLVFQINLFRKWHNRKELQWMARWQLYYYKWFPAFIQIIQKTASLFLQTPMKFIVSKEYFIARHDDKMCFLPNCRYHIILIASKSCFNSISVKQLLQKLDAFCFNYQHVNCLCTLFKYRFIGKNVIKSGQVFDNLQSAVHFNQQNRGVQRVPSIAKKRLLRKK